MLTKKKIIAGINGFGRVGLHLLKYWLDRAERSTFQINYINDDFLGIKKAHEIITRDKYVVFNKYKVSISNGSLIFLKPDGHKYSVTYTNKPKSGIPWIGEPEIFFECSGKNPSINDCKEFVIGKTKLVIISQTSWDADKTLIYGFNHEEYNNKLKVISYGSCTVNAYVALANYINKKYSIVDSDANFVHNIQEYKLKNFNTLLRKFCTLEKSGPNLLNFINKNNFSVNYTVIPYPGVSILDLRFNVKKNVSKDDFIKDLHHAFTEGTLEELYHIEETDTGPEVHNCTTYSAVFIKDQIKILNKNIYMYGYFDNENSVNRYYDLANYIAGKWLGKYK